MTASQINAAQHAAVTAGLIVESRNSIPSFTEILDVATVFGILLALGILAMSVGLLSSETASNLRPLTAAGASASGPPVHYRGHGGGAGADRCGGWPGGRVRGGDRVLPY